MTMLRACALVVLWLGATARIGHAGPESEDLPPGQSAARVFGAADGLRNLSIIGIVQDRDGLLWLATEDGVYRFDGERFTHFSIRDLSSNLSFAIGLAPDG
ncbi:MAG TPA: two-component regulator propeller domain-containing protein, partial [Kofleriaceae bacterium]|nr:two-component regulator propeller domain-containing protein [Kofleriaceae bacterium]